MRQLRFSILVLALAMLAMPALAEKIVHLSNGSSMPIRGYKIEGEMIMVDVGDDGYIGFPKTMVERIEDAGSDVWLPPSSRKNQMFEGGVQSTSPVRGRVPSRHNSKNGWSKRPADSMRPAHNEVDDKGYYKPYAGTGHGGKERFSVSAASLPPRPLNPEEQTQPGAAAAQGGKLKVDGMPRNPKAKQNILRRPVPLDQAAETKSDKGN